MRRRKEKTEKKDGGWKEKNKEKKDIGKRWGGMRK